MYSPQLARFASRDPLPQDGHPDTLFDNNPFGQRLALLQNLYKYCDNSPLNKIDPSGLKCCGPEVTLWFMRDVVIFRTATAKYNEMLAGTLALKQANAEGFVAGVSSAG